jgi:hypothetical protein
MEIDKDFKLDELCCAIQNFEKHYHLELGLRKSAKT